MAIAEERSPVTQGSSSEPKDDSSMAPKIPASPIEAIKAVAGKFAAQPLPSSDPDVWGVLTAISNNARKRKQVINFLCECYFCEFFNLGFRVFLILWVL